MEDAAAKAAPGLTREFVYSIDLPNPDEFEIFDQPEIDEAKTRRQLVEAFPELVWKDGEGHSGRLLLIGESHETPPDVGISFFCKQSRGPFQLKVRLRDAGLIRAEELKDRFIQALPGFCLEKDRFAFMTVDDYDSIVWVNAAHANARTAPELPSVDKIASSPFVELKIPVERPCVAIFERGLEILLSRALLEAMSARIDEIKAPVQKRSEQERLETIRGARAREILTAAVPAGTDGNAQLPMALLPRDARYLLAQLLERGLAEVVHFNSYGMALSAKRVHVDHFEMRAGPTAGFGGVRFSIGAGREILSVQTWVS